MYRIFSISNNLKCPPDFPVIKLREKTPLQKSKQTKSNHMFLVQNEVSRPRQGTGDPLNDVTKMKLDSGAREWSLTDFILLDSQSTNRFHNRLTVLVRRIAPVVFRRFTYLASA